MRGVAKARRWIIGATIHQHGFQPGFARRIADGELFEPEGEGFR